MTLRIIFNDDSVKEYKGVCSFYGGTSCGELVINFPHRADSFDFFSIKSIEFVYIAGKTISTDKV